MSNHKPESSEVEKNSRSGCFKWGVILLLIILVLFACSFLSMMVLFASAGSELESVVSSGGSDKIALIHIDGVISESATVSLLGGVQGSTPARVEADLERALEDNNVKAIILSIQSPGGEAVASDVIRQSVANATLQKPVVVYTSTMAASGGYMVASAADRIVMHPGALTGSIGAIMQLQDLEGLYEKLGIETVTLKTGEFKDNGELFNENGTQLRTIYQELLDEVHQDFVEAVAMGRGMELAEVNALADGRLFSGKQAEQNGLIDRTGYFELAVEEAEQLAGIEDATIVEYNTYTFFDQLFAPSFGSLFGAGSSSGKGGVYYLPAL